jgi:hypothetical protein
MTPKLPNVPFNQIVKNPLTWGFVMLFTLMISLVTIFVSANFSNASKNDENCKEDKAILRAELKEVRAENKWLYNSINLKNGVTSNLNNVIDSLNNKNDIPK